MKEILIALQFLTILPIKIKSEIKEEDFGRSLFYFPLAGVLIGLALAAVAVFLRFLPDLVTAACLLIVSIFITGGIHLDGFADTCDGFYGAKPKEEILRIMRDSHIGVMGAVGVTLLLLLKFVLFSSIPKDFLWKALIMMCCFARWVQAAGCLLPYARTEGKAAAFIKYARKANVITGGVFVLLIFSGLSGLKGVAIFFSSLVIPALFIYYVRHRISGMTGDTLGAASEIAEVSTLFSALIFGLIWN